MRVREGASKDLNARFLQDCGAGDGVAELQGEECPAEVGGEFFAGSCSAREFVQMLVLFDGANNDNAKTFCSRSEQRLWEANNDFGSN